MSKLINWLLQPTPDGATYLQAIITLILLFFVIYVFFDTVMNSNNNEVEKRE